MKFSYKVYEKNGSVTEGVIDASDKFSAARALREKGGFPLSVTPERKNKGKGLSFELFGRVKLHEKIIFTRNLAGMLSSGLSLARALSVLEKQTTNKKFKDVLATLMKEIDSGSTLSEGMRKFPKVFSTLFISMMRAGEESGNLAKSLTEVGLHLEKSYNLNRKIKGAMTYPSIIIGAIFLIGILMFIYVVPTLTKTFKDLGGDLPSSTKLIIWISDNLKDHALLFFGGIVVIASGMMYLIKRPKTKKYFDFVVLRLPVIGVITKEVNAARTTRTLSSLLSSGVDVSKALSITKEVLQNHYYKKVIDTAVVNVQKGVPLSVVFKEHVELYPVMVGEMMEVGEETGKLSAMLLDIALFYESEVENKTKDLSTIIEPVLMVFIGGAVGFFAISMISPMYSLMDSIS